MRGRTLAAAVAVLTVALPAAPGAALSRPGKPSLTGAQFTGEGFDKCEAPPSSGLRSWLGSPYRAVNIYMGGINRACSDQPELSTQWLTTVTSNGWAVIPTYVGSQAACTTSSKTHTIAASTAASQGTAEADDAAARMAALGLVGDTAIPTLPVYFDMEPYHVGSTYAKCDNAVLAFLDAWSRELHLKGYLAGAYGTTNSVIKQLVTRQSDATFQEPDDIWFADWNESATTTGESGIPDKYWVGHRIHQFRGGHNESFNGNTFNIDNDAIDGDVVAAVTPTAPQGPPYHFAAAPPAGGTLKERSTPETTPDNMTGVRHPTGDDLPVMCQTVGEKIDGSVVWDQLQDGAFVSDIFTTTTGGLSFTAGVPRCDTADTTPPVAAITPLPAGTLAASQAISWSGTDDSSGIKSYDVRYRRAPWNGGFFGWRHPTAWNATTATSSQLALRPGSDYCFAVRATDSAGNTGRWSAPACTARALDDRALSADAAWRHVTGTHYYLHTATSTRDQWVSLRLPSAQVARVGLVATSCAKCGAVEVRAGRHLVGTVTLTSSRTRPHQLFMLPPFSLRTKTIRVETTSNELLVRIDGLVVSRT